MSTARLGGPTSMRSCRARCACADVAEDELSKLCSIEEQDLPVQGVHARCCGRGACGCGRANTLHSTNESRSRCTEPGCADERLVLGMLGRLPILRPIRGCRWCIWQQRCNHRRERRCQRRERRRRGRQWWRQWWRGCHRWQRRHGRERGQQRQQFAFMHRLLQRGHGKLRRWQRAVWISVRVHDGMRQVPSR